MKVKFNIKKIPFILPAALLFALPFTASATPVFYPVSCSGTFQTFSDLVCFATGLISMAIPIVAGIALLVFFWGLAMFIKNAGSEDGQGKGRQIMLWGIVSLFVMVSIWGIVAFLNRDILGMSYPVIPQLPQATF